MPYVGTLQSTKLNDSEVSRCSQWWDAFEVPGVYYNQHDLMLVVEWLRAIMRADKWPFVDQNGTVTCASDSSAWCPFLLLDYQNEQATVTIPYIARVLAVMRRHFLNGETVFAELQRAAKTWHEDGRPAQLLDRHYGKAEDAHSNENMTGADGGIYIWIAPEWDAELLLGGEVYPYRPSESCQQASILGRRQIGLGETHRFKQRRNKYREKDGWTNTLQRQARLLADEEIDCISEFEDRVLVGMPSIRGTQPLDRKIVETLLNLAFGAKRSSARPWGLQRQSVDNTGYQHFITHELATAIRQKVFEDLVTPGAVCKVKPGWADPYWRTLQDWICQQVAAAAGTEVAEETPADGDAAAPTYCIEAIQRCLLNRSWQQDLADYPAFPIGFWSNAGISGVPKELLPLYELLDGSEDEENEEHAPSARDARKRSREVAALNTRNAFRKKAKAAAKTSRSASIGMEGPGEGSVGGAQAGQVASGSGSSSLTIASAPRVKTGPQKGQTKKSSMKF